MTAKELLERMKAYYLVTTELDLAHDIYKAGWAAEVINTRKHIPCPLCGKFYHAHADLICTTEDYIRRRGIF